MALKAFNSYYDYPAICDMLGAIRDEHLCVGLSNPLTDKPLVKIAMKDISERRLEAPAWWRASEAAAKPEVRQIEHAAARKEESWHKVAWPEAAAEIIAEPEGTPSELITVISSVEHPDLESSAPVEEASKEGGAARRRYANSGRLRPRR